MGPTTAAEVRQKLHADPARLNAVARACVGRSDSQVTGWELTELSGGAGGNPTSDGIFRVAGRLADPTDQDGPTWSVILKAVRSPVETGEAWDQPGDAVYWRREVEVFASGMLEAVQGLAVPQCWGIEELPDAAAWLWLEDLGTLHRSAWQVEDFHLAARALGRFHAPYLTGVQPIPNQAWLNRSYLRGFHDYLEPWWQHLTARVQGADPGLAGLRRDRAEPGVAAVLDIVADPTPLLRVLDDLPMTLAHNDTHIDNLTIRPGRAGTPEVVALDWQMVGPASPGADLGQLLSECPSSVSPASRAGFEAEVLATYQDELTRADAGVDLATVQRSYCVEALLRQSLWEVLLLSLRLEALPAADQQGQAQAVADFTANIVGGHLPMLAAQARDAVGS